MRKFLPILLLALAAPAGAQNVTQCLVSNVYVPCSMAPQPSFAQAPVSSKSSGSVASINAAYGSNTVKGNTLVVVFANGNNNNPTAPITDTLTLTWFKAVQVANSTAFETEIWYAPNTAGGADTVTVTPGGSNASIAMTIYEVQGLVYPTINSSPTGAQALDQTTSNTGTGATSPSVSLTPILPNEYVFVGFGLGTAAQTITVVSPYNNDSAQQNPTTPAGLFSFVSASLFKGEMATTSPSATATSEPWAVAVASFKTLSVPIQGTVQGMGVAGTPSGGVHSVQGVSGGTALPVTCTSGSNCPVNATLQAGSAIAGKVGIDQTTPGTTNAVSATNLPTTADTNTGNASASTLRVVLATNQPALTNAQPANVTQINSNTISTAATGTQKVGIVGNAGAAVDQAPGSAVPANAVMEGLSDGTNTRFALSDTNGRQLVRPYPDTTTVTFSISKKFAASSTTDNFFLPGNATNTVLLRKLTLTCTQTTAGTVNVEVIKRSAADTSGTSAAFTVVPQDANFTGGVSAPLSYTGTGPSVGAAVGDIDNAQIGCNATATAGPNDIYVSPSTWMTNPIVLRGTAQGVAINLGGAVTGGNITITAVYSETTTP